MKRILCWLFGHQFYLVKKLTRTSRKIACTRCGQAFGMNDDAHAVIPWDHELDAMYEVIGVDAKAVEQ